MRRALGRARRDRVLCSAQPMLSRPTAHAGPPPRAAAGAAVVSPCCLAPRRPRAAAERPGDDPHRHPRPAEPDARLRAPAPSGWEAPSWRGPTTPRRPPGTPRASATCARPSCRSWASTTASHRRQPRQRQPEGQLGRLRGVHLARRRGRGARRRPAQLPARASRSTARGTSRPVRGAPRRRREPDRHAAACASTTAERRRLRRGRPRHGPAPEPPRPRGLHREPLDERLPPEPRAEHLQPPHQPAAPALRSRLPPERLELQPRVDRLAGRARSTSPPSTRPRSPPAWASTARAATTTDSAAIAQRGHDQFLLERVRAARLPVLVRLRRLVAAARHAHALGRLHAQQLVERAHPRLLRGAGDAGLRRGRHSRAAAAARVLRRAPVPDAELVPDPDDPTDPLRCGPSRTPSRSAPASSGC